MNSNENACLKIEPYEIPAVDLSGYQYDIVPTYKMIDDADDQDTLFRLQFLQAFGITDREYHPEIVSAMVDYLYDRYNRVPGIREIIEAHPLYNAPGAATTATDDADASPPDSPSPSGHITSEADNGEMIFCMMFSFHLFDLFHKCLRHAKHGEEIPQTLRDEMKECIRTLF
jgi:hypothetical protein